MNEGVVAMILTPAIASDPPGSRRFRRIAPLAVLIGLFTVILGPGLATQVTCQVGSLESTEIGKVDPLVRQIVTASSQASGESAEASLSSQGGG
jgi:hypothetical protein